MKCIHSHLLPGIDDGASYIGETIKLLKSVEGSITEMILTPHYNHGTAYNSNNEEKIKLLNFVKDEIKKENIDIKVYLGNEVFIFENIIENINNGNISTLNNSRYILVELPMSNYYEVYKDMLLELIDNDYIPIVAHPERYLYFQNDLDLVDELLDIGVLFQGNIASIKDYYRNAKNTFFKMLNYNLYTFLATDLHYDSIINYELDDILAEIKEYIGEEKFKKLTITNVNKVINNEDINDI